MITTLDNLYARAWELDFGKHFFDNDHNEPSPHNPREVTVETEYRKTETCSRPETARESSSESLRPSAGLCEGTDTDPYMERDSGMTSD